jgi:type I restriction enzyme S subunit
MISSELPDTWLLSKLGELCFTTSGGTPSRKRDDFYNGNIPWVKSGELSKGLITKTEEYITDEAVKNSSAKIFPTGTLLIALYGATIGKLGFLGVDAATNQAICGIYKNDFLDLDYLYYFLYHNKNKLIEQGAGGAQPNISQTILKDLDVSVPPLPEQQRIVAKIEELFSELDKGIETLKTAKQQLKVYRQSVLKYAFEGKLTNPDVKEGELPEGWEISTLANIGTWRGGGTPSKSNLSYWENGSIDWVTAKDMKSDIITSTIDKISPESVVESSAKMIPSNSILIVMRSGILRRTLPIALVLHEVTVNQDLQAITPHAVNANYLFYCLKAFSESIRKICSKDGTTVESIDSSALKKFTLPIAPHSIQEKIVKEIESRLSVCDKIEESIEQGLQQAEALRQSILKKAFEGKLVPQDPNDEPASVLLEHIKAERAAAKPVKKTKTKKVS